MNYRNIIKIILVACISLTTLFWSSNAIASTNLPLTYEDVLGTGLANKCPEVFGSSRGRGVISIAPGESLDFDGMCLEPTEFYVKEESGNKRKEAEFVKGKILTRSTSSLDFVKGTITAKEDGTLVMTEREGLDYQAISIKLPGGEMVAFLFSMKDYVGTSQPGLEGLSTSTNFEGSTFVPTYRGANFIDPKGRGMGTGYSAAEGLPAKRSEYDQRSVKDDSTSTGKLYLEIAKLNSETGEIAGTFECEQLSGTDLGATEAKELIIRGVFYAHVS
ncbi:photosystem II manganese-stabilizing protein PsbO [Thalassoporum mexicanum PCC 7367]|uniref:photosystem II manganese-stabilizing polypeptide n=1 Tax=Thalassoporum mexicanum TaxID=3457544 RepID=UPI00029FED4E|nr:photosystem II manganese-stabilizing polypeptide [Pseudanabaena sp. PCC 7367]AFY70752.1 photosystem II manganese-stabilizing protein PsbO [Pseudanabaena sp. PCC 7367]